MILQKYYNLLKEQFGNNYIYKEVSIAITGSFCRKDIRINNSKILSDLDILVFVKNKKDINIIKNKLVNFYILEEVKISYIFTIEKMINKNTISRGFLKDIKKEDFY